MRATLLYTVLRLAMFAAALGLLYLAGARGVLLILIAAVVSALGSYILLSRPREAMAGNISRRITRVRDGLEQGARSEDGD